MFIYAKPEGGKGLAGGTHLDEGIPFSVCAVISVAVHHSKQW